MASNAPTATDSTADGIPLENRLIGTYDEAGGVILNASGERIPASAPVYVAYVAGETPSILALADSPLAVMDHPGVDLQHPDTSFGRAHHVPATDELTAGVEAVLTFQNDACERDIDPLADADTADLIQYAAAHDLPASLTDRLLTDLYQSIPACKRRTGTGSIVVQRDDEGLTLRVSLDLFRKQPMGVICRPIHRHLREGKATIADVAPRSASVAAAILDKPHLAIRVVPTPIWIDQHTP